MPRRICIVCAWAGIALLALGLRLDDLAARPMHADEATGARVLALRMESRAYAFDPRHFHGPLLSVAAEPVVRLHGQSGWRDLGKRALRVAPAAAGSLMVLCPLLWIGRFGQGPALAAAALLATSPLLVYYSRMFIHESLLGLLAMLALPALVRTAARPRIRSALLAGVLVGLMWATKETFVITLACWALAASLCAIPSWRGCTAASTRQGLTPYVIPLLALSLAAAATAAILYTDGLKHPQGAVDAIRTFFLYETGASHEKPGGYYLHLLLWPKWLAGILWWEGGVVLLGAGALLLARGCSGTIHPASRRRLIVFLAIATALQVVVYSAIAYKTPWLMLVPWAHACLLAGALFSLAPRTRPVRILLYSALALVMAFQTYQSVLAAGRFASDPRNPYTCVPTTRDVETLESWLAQLAPSFPPDAPGAIGVLGTQYWPLPWYLRRFDQVGYWTEPAQILQRLPVVFAMPDAFGPADSLLSGTHIALPRGLRADAPMMLYLRHDVWQRWMEDGPQ